MFLKQFKYVLLGLLVVNLLVIDFAYAGKNAGGSFSQTISFKGDNLRKSPFTLKLVGTSVRKKALFDIYRAGFYAQNEIKEADDALRDKGAKRMQMMFVYKNIAKDKFRASWLTGIKSNNSSKAVAKQKAYLNRFLDFFDKDIVRGTTIYIDDVPYVGTKVYINGKLKGTIKSPGFYRLLLATWMGNNPPSKSFQQAFFS